MTAPLLEARGITRRYAMPRLPLVLTLALGRALCFVQAPRTLRPALSHRRGHGRPRVGPVFVHDIAWRHRGAQGGIARQMRFTLFRQFSKVYSSVEK